MDRNLYLTNYHFTVISVALRKESVDRNIELRILFLNMLVALRKESVDRNMRYIKKHLHKHLSLSARRAWIEIILCCDSKDGHSGRSPQGERG